MILGVRKNGLVVCDKNKKELMFINYSTIASWGVNSNVFVVVIQKTEFDTKKIYFECNNVSSIVFTF